MKNKGRSTQYSGESNVPAAHIHILKFDEPVKSSNSVIPAKAGIYKHMISLDPRLRGDDIKTKNQTFY